MKGLGFLAMVLLAIEVVAQPAWAVDTARADQNGLLVLLFLGVCALIVVAQMVPALILMLGTISGFAKRVGARKQVGLASVKQDDKE